LENHENQAPLGRDLNYWTWGTLLTIDEAFRDPRSPGFVKNMDNLQQRFFLRA
jgi:hypothetical protein